MNYGINKLKNRRRSNKANLIIIGLLFLVVGYALLQAKVHGFGAVNVSTGGKWNIYLDNISVKEGSVKAIEPAIINSNDKTKASFKVNLANADDYYEFEADIVNGGKYDAMITNISLSNIPNEYSKYFIYTLSYSDDREILKNDMIPVGKKDRIKVNVKFNENENSADLLKASSSFTDVSINLSFEITFGQLTEEAVNRIPPNSSIIRILGLDKDAQLDTEINFAKYSSDTNGRGLYIYTNSDGSIYNPEEPIYYYRGAVTKNNLIFANYCWKIVRTTETGGTKLIFNGVPSNGTCDNTEDASHIGTRPRFNDRYALGYMYDTNQDSLIKGVIDSWYEENIESETKHYGKYLEDTIWCSDRSTPTVQDNMEYYGYSVRSFLKKEKPLVTCPLQEDSYSLKEISINYNKNLNGNKLLDYPIALITGDEAQLAGYAYYDDNDSTHSYDSYLYTKDFYWLLSPFALWPSNSYAYQATITNGAISTNTPINTTASVRPSISLVPGTKVKTNKTGEAGTVENPYVVIED